jgi:hypothetical protein
MGSVEFPMLEDKFLAPKNIANFIGDERSRFV